MNHKTSIDQLWREFRTAINQAYAEANETRNEDGVCLRDYAENISWSDSLQRLLERETDNERQHRVNRPSIPGFSSITAAKLILLGQASRGAHDDMPRATAFLVCRQSAIEAQVLGYLCKAYLSPDWHSKVESHDYSQLMQGGN